MGNILSQPDPKATEPKPSQPSKELICLNDTLYVRDNTQPISSPMYPELARDMKLVRRLLRSNKSHVEILPVLERIVPYRDLRLPDEHQLTFLREINSVLDFEEETAGTKPAVPGSEDSDALLRAAKTMPVDQEDIAELRCRMYYLTQALIAKVDACMNWKDLMDGFALVDGLTSQAQKAGVKVAAGKESLVQEVRWKIKRRGVYAELRDEVARETKEGDRVRVGWPFSYF